MGSFVRTEAASPADNQYTAARSCPVQTVIRWRASLLCGASDKSKGPGGTNGFRGDCGHIQTVCVRHRMVDWERAEWAVGVVRTS
jgi:hypothetical protein